LHIDFLLDILNLISEGYGRTEKTALPHSFKDQKMICLFFITNCRFYSALLPEAKKPCGSQGGIINGLWSANLIGISPLPGSLRAAPIA